MDLFWLAPHGDGPSHSPAVRSFSAPHCIRNSVSVWLDPLAKAIYVLRCFYGESLKTGRDLKAELKKFRVEPKSARVGTLLLLLAFALPMNTGRSAEADSPIARPTPQPPSLSAPDLERSIDEVLRQREFSWRMPREKTLVKDEAKKGV